MYILLPLLFFIRGSRALWMLFLADALAIVSVNQAVGLSHYHRHHVLHPLSPGEAPMIRFGARVAKRIEPGPGPRIDQTTLSLEPAP
jgi:hypothetical protein